VWIKARGAIPALVDKAIIFLKSYSKFDPSPAIKYSQPRNKNKIMFNEQPTKKGLKGINK